MFDIIAAVSAMALFAVVLIIGVYNKKIIRLFLFRPFSIEIKTA